MDTLGLLSVLHGLFHLQSAVRAKMRFLSRPQRLWKRSSITCSAALAVQALAGTAIAQPALNLHRLRLSMRARRIKSRRRGRHADRGGAGELAKDDFEDAAADGWVLYATYPDKQWREVPCKTPSNKLYPPKHGGTTSSEIVGGAGPDFSAVERPHN